MNDHTKSLPLDAELQARLSALAAKLGRSVEGLAQDILQSHLDEQERLTQEQQEDEERWQRYLATGQSVPYQTVRAKLHRLASEAAQKADPQ